MRAFPHPHFDKQIPDQQEPQPRGSKSSSRLVRSHHPDNSGGQGTNAVCLAQGQQEQQQVRFGFHHLDNNGG